MGAIGITLKKAEGAHDLGTSKFFGAPALPEGWADRFSDDVIFFAQLRLADIAALDTENRLPHTGYLYLFLDVEMYPYQTMAYYCTDEPRVVVDDFNAVEPRFAHLQTDWLMQFAPAADDADGTRLFGVPSSGCDGGGELLLQFDPLAADIGFLDSIDGYAYCFFGEGADRIDGIRFVIDRS